LLQLSLGCKALGEPVHTHKQAVTTAAAAATVN
jgi:hypothetical protein